MKRVTMVLSMLALIVGMIGCGSTPTQRWDAATTAVQTARNVAVTLHKGGAISTDDLGEIHRVDLATRGALDVAYTQLPSGGKTFDKYMAVAEAGLTSIAELYGKPKGVK
jgi:hypothetical protein